MRLFSLRPTCSAADVDVEALVGGVDPMLLTLGTPFTKPMRKARWRVTLTQSEPLADVLRLMAPAVSDRARAVFEAWGKKLVEFGEPLELVGKPPTDARLFFFMNVLGPPESEGADENEAPVRRVADGSDELLVTEPLRDALREAGVMGLSIELYEPGQHRRSTDAAHVARDDDVLDTVDCTSCGRQTMEIRQGNDAETWRYTCASCGAAYSGDAG